LPGWLPEKSLSCQAFSTFDNQSNRKIKEKVNKTVTRQTEIVFEVF
jgi:hypothetical protein